MTRLEHILNKHIIALAVMVHLLAAYLSEGFLHPDEHYYALDFAYYKLGMLSDLSGNWEWLERLRPWSLPALFTVLLKPFHGMGSINPFHAELFLRMVSSLFALWALLRWCQSEQLPLKWPLFFWPLVFMHARTSSENWSVAFLLLGLSFIPSCLVKVERRQALISGALLALSVWMRFQLGLMVAGLIVHWLWTRRGSLLWFLSTFVLMSLFFIAIDRWGYESWVLTPWEYLRANLLESKIDQFGRSPWWFYAWQSCLKLVPVFSLPLLLALGIFVKKFPRHEWVWMILPFVLFHHAIGHKELRFLYPILPLLVAMAVTLWSPTKFPRLWTFAFALNLIIVAVACFRPANSLARLYRAVWQAPELSQLYVLPDNKGRHLVWERPVLLRPDFRAVNVTHINDIPAGAFWALGTAGMHEDWWQSKGCVVVYRSYPLWLLRLDVLQWTKRSTLWSLAHCP